MDLQRYHTSGYAPGASLLKQIMWYFLGAVLVRSALLPFSGMRVALLRLFGAQIGKNVRLKPGLRIKFPWRLSLGDNSWLGEDVWIDNLACVSIGSNCCVSQGAYLCTGNHDWSAEKFDLIVEPISIKDRAWIAARACVGPGVTVSEGAVLVLGGVACSDLEAWAVYSGNPASKVGARRIESLNLGPA